MGKQQYRVFYNNGLYYFNQLTDIAKACKIPIHDISRINKGESLKQTDKCPRDWLNGFIFERGTTNDKGDFISAYKFEFQPYDTVVVDTQTNNKQQTRREINNFESENLEKINWSNVIQFHRTKSAIGELADLVEQIWSIEENHNLLMPRTKDAKFCWVINNNEKEMMVWDEVFIIMKEILRNAIEQRLDDKKIRSMEADRLLNALGDEFDKNKDDDKDDDKHQKKLQSAFKYKLLKIAKHVAKTQQGY